MSSIGLSWHELEGFWASEKKENTFAPSHLHYADGGQQVSCTSNHTLEVNEKESSPFLHSPCNSFPSLITALNFLHLWWPVMFQRRVWKKVGTKRSPAAADEGFLGKVYAWEQLSSASTSAKGMESYGSHLSKTREVVCISDFSISQPWEVTFHVSTPRRLIYTDGHTFFARKHILLQKCPAMLRILLWAIIYFIWWSRN